MAEYILADDATPTRKAKPAGVMGAEIGVKATDPVEKGDRLRPANCVVCQVVCTHLLVRDSRPFSSRGA